MEKLTGLLSNGDIDFLKVTPSHLNILSLRLGSRRQTTVTGTVIIGGEALLHEQLVLWREEFPKTRLINEYGPTETVVGCCVYEVPCDDLSSGGVPIGKPIAN